MSDQTPDPQDAAEALDSDQLGTTDDPDVEPDFPLDRLLGADEYGTTPAQEQVGEPLDERVERDEPDPLVAELDAADEEAHRDAQVTSVASGPNALELQLDEDALAAIDAIEPLAPILDDEEVETTEVGRLLEPGVDDDVFGLDDEPNSVARAVDEHDLSAEEAAVHLTDDPPMHLRGQDRGDRP